VSVAIEVYRTTVRPGGEERWGFEPFEHRRLYRADEPTGGFIEAAPRPFAVILAPDGAEVAWTQGGERGLFVFPGGPGWGARGAYRAAAEGRAGLALVR
jgi:hypothetical protein